MIKEVFMNLMNFVFRGKPSARAPNQEQMEDRADKTGFGWRLLDWLGINRTVRKAREDVTYFTCLKQLSETMAKMPYHLYHWTENGAERIDAATDHLAYLLEVRPNNIMTPTTFWGTVENNRNHYGNAYVYIRWEFKRQRYGGALEVVDLWVMPSNNVRVMVDDAGVFAGEGRLWYVYTDAITGTRYVFADYEVLHFKSSHTMNGIVGESVQAVLAQTVRGSLASQEYLDKLYEQGMTAKATLEYTGTLSPDAKEQLRKSFEEFGNGVKNMGRVLPVPLGFKLTPMDIKLTDAQFFELKKYGALQLAAAFGIKPNQINDYSKSSYSNSEQQTIAFQVDTMLYPIKQYEEEIQYKLLSGERELAGQFVKINEKALLRTDTKTQMEILTIGVKGSVLTVDEARKELGRPKVNGGDRILVNGAAIALDQVGIQYIKTPPAEEPEKTRKEG